jgi:hypothetical protein
MNVNTISLKALVGKANKILQDIYYNSIITNLKFQHKPKYQLSYKNSHIKIDLLLFIT